MSDDIVSRSGAVVGQWDGQDVQTLQNELARIKTEVSGDKVEPTGVPHQDQLPEDLKGFTAYILWGCDVNGVCLVGSGANRTETIESIREFYGNQIAKDAMARHDPE